MADTALVRKDSIEEICGHRARAIEAYARVFDALSDARRAHVRACAGSAYVTAFPFETLRRTIDGNRPRFDDEVRQMVDRDIWNGLMVTTKLGSLMDRHDREKFHRSLQDDPPPVTADNVFATLSTLAANANVMFERGLVNLFRNLSRSYRSHDGFKIGGRIVLSGAIIFYGDLASLRDGDLLTDIDRVMHILDGKPPSEYSSTDGLEGVVRAWLNRNSSGVEINTSYFRVRWFKKGTIHLWFTREDLVNAANMIIAKHFGNTIGASPDVAMKPGPTRKPDTDAFFPTPRNLTRQMVRAAELTAGMSILEPSAGLGDIIAEITWTEQDYRIDCFEAHWGRAAEVADRFAGKCRMLCCDFLSVDPAAEGAKPYDRILMNPPFTRGLDAVHVLHAARFLAPGGRLVAIMSDAISGADPADTRPPGVLKTLIERWGGQIIPNRRGSFKSVGTSIDTVMVVIDRPAE